MKCSRRSFIIMAGGLATSVATNLFGQEGNTGNAYADKAAADDWLSRWMDAPGAAGGTLHLGRFADRMYFLTKEISWTPNAGQQAHTVRVPAGFVTDFASIPRVFWSLLPPDGAYTYPAIIHDYLYWEQPSSRREADLVFRYAMEDFNVAPVAISAIYNGVALGGSGAWNDNAALKAAGEKRILKEYPTDPRARWSEWKRRPGVF